MGESLIFPVDTHTLTHTLAKERKKHRKKQRKNKREETVKKHVFFSYG